MNDIVPCTVSLAFFFILFAFFGFLRYLRHREIMMLAEKGLGYPPRINGKDTLRWGIAITAIGLALIVGVLPVAWRNAWPLMLVGLIPTFFGLGLIVIYVLTREEKTETKPDEEPQLAETLDE